MRDDIAERPGSQCKAGSEITAEPQLDPCALPRLRAVLVDVETAGPAEAVQQGNALAPAPGAVADRMAWVPPGVAAIADLPGAPGVAVLATPLRADRDGRPGAPWPGRQHPGAGQPRMAQHVGGGVAELGQVVERFLRDLAAAVGLADGQGQPDHEAGSPPPCRGQAALGGHGDRGLPQVVVAGEVAVLDAAGMGVGELPSHPEQQELPRDGRRADPRVIDRLGRGDAKLVEQGPWPGAVGCPATLRPVQGLGRGQAVAGQDQHELRRPPAGLAGDPFRVAQPDVQQAEPAQPVGVDVAVVPAPPARRQVRVQVPPARADGAVGELGLLAPA
jgi:hypothetical protein